MLPLLLLLSLAHARCRDPFTNEALALHVHDGMEGFVFRKLAPFNRARAEIQQGVPCLEEIVDPVALAGYYRLQGLSLFGESLDYQPDMMRYFQIATVLDPSFGFDERALPPGHELRELYLDAAGRPPFVELPLPESRYQVFIDGRAVNTWPIARPMLMQLMTPSGKVRYSELLVADGEEDLPDLVTRSGRRQAALWTGVSSLGLSVAAGGLTVASLLAEERYYALTDPIVAGREAGSPDQEEVDRARDRANGLGVAAQVTGGVALGLGGAALVVFPW